MDFNQNQQFSKQINLVNRARVAPQPKTNPNAALAPKVILTAPQQLAAFKATWSAAHTTYFEEMEAFCEQNSREKFMEDPGPFADKKFVYSHTDPNMRIFGWSVEDAGLEANLNSTKVPLWYCDVNRALTKNATYHYKTKYNKGPTKINYPSWKPGAKAREAKATTLRTTDNQQKVLAGIKRSHAPDTGWSGTSRIMERAGDDNRAMFGKNSVALVHLNSVHRAALHGVASQAYDLREHLMVKLKMIVAALACHSLNPQELSALQQTCPDLLDKYVKLAIGVPRSRDIRCHNVFRQQLLNDTLYSPSAQGLDPGQFDQLQEVYELDGDMLEGIRPDDEYDWILKLLDKELWARWTGMRLGNNNTMARRLVHEVIKFAKDWGEDPNTDDDVDLMSDFGDWWLRSPITEYMQRLEGHVFFFFLDWQKLFGDQVTYCSDCQRPLKAIFGMHQNGHQLIHCGSASKGISMSGFAMPHPLPICLDCLLCFRPNNVGFFSLGTHLRDDHLQDPLSYTMEPHCSRRGYERALNGMNSQMVADVHAELAENEFPLAMAERTNLEARHTLAKLQLPGRGHPLWELNDHSLFKAGPVFNMKGIQGLEYTRSHLAFDGIQIMMTAARLRINDTAEKVKLIVQKVPLIEAKQRPCSRSAHFMTFECAIYDHKSGGVSLHFQRGGNQVYQLLMSDNMAGEARGFHLAGKYLTETMELFLSDWNLFNPKVDFAELWENHHAIKAQVHATVSIDYNQWKYVDAQFGRSRYSDFSYTPPAGNPNENQMWHLRVSQMQALLTLILTMTPGSLQADGDVFFAWDPNAAGLSWIENLQRKYDLEWRMELRFFVLFLTDEPKYRALTFTKGMLGTLFRWPPSQDAQQLKADPNNNKRWLMLSIAKVNDSGVRDAMAHANSYMIDYSLPFEATVTDYAVRVGQETTTRRLMSNLIYQPQALLEPCTTVVNAFIKKMLGWTTVTGATHKDDQSDHALAIAFVLRQTFTPFLGAYFVTDSPASQNGLFVYLAWGFVKKYSIQSRANQRVDAWLEASIINGEDEEGPRFWAAVDQLLPNGLLQVNGYGNITSPDTARDYIYEYEFQVGQNDCLGPDFVDVVDYVERQPMVVNKSNKLVSNQEHGFIRNLQSLPSPETVAGRKAASGIWKSKTYKETKEHYEGMKFLQHMTERGCLPVLGMFRTGCLQDEQLKGGIDQQFKDTLLWPAAWSQVDLSRGNKHGTNWGRAYNKVVSSIENFTAKRQEHLEKLKGDLKEELFALEDGEGQQREGPDLCQHQISISSPEGEHCCLYVNVVDFGVLRVFKLREARCFFQCFGYPGGLRQGLDPLSVPRYKGKDVGAYLARKQASGFYFYNDLAVMTEREWTWYWHQMRLEYDLEEPREVKRVHQDMNFDDFRSICYNSFCFWDEEVLAAESGVEVHKLIRMTQEFQYHHKFFDEWQRPFVAGGETDYYMCFVPKMDRQLNLEDEGELKQRAEFSPTLNPITWVDLCEPAGHFDGVTARMSLTQAEATQSQPFRPREYQLGEVNREIETYGVRPKSLKSKLQKFFADEYSSKEKTFVMWNNGCYDDFKKYKRDLGLFKKLMIKAEEVPATDQIDSRSVKSKPTSHPIRKQPGRHLIGNSSFSTAPSTPQFVNCDMNWATLLRNFVSKKKTLRSHNMIAAKLSEMFKRDPTDYKKAQLRNAKQKIYGHKFV